MTQQHNLQIQIQRLPHIGDLPLPHYATVGSAGMDIYAALNEDVVVEPMNRVAIPTGIAIAIPHGYEAQIRSRSGLSYKKGIVVLNTPGTIDSDYRGEIQVILYNTSNAPYVVQHGQRIAQMVVQKHESVEWNVVNDLNETERGSGGFGSTGVS